MKECKLSKNYFVSKAWLLLLKLPIIQYTFSYTYLFLICPFFISRPLVEEKLVLEQEAMSKIKFAQKDVRHI